MIEVRKNCLGELNQIIDVANRSFVPVRYEGFDFRKRMPKIYAANKDYSDIHFAVIEDGKMRSVAGNLLQVLNLNGTNYSYSIIGTVSTLPSESNKGYMALLMKEIDKENIEKGVVFSMLTGKRQRYNRYGYERSGSRISYTMNTHYFKHNDVSEDITIRPYIIDDLDAIFEIYLDNQPLILRKKEEFILNLRISNSFIYTILDGDCIVGYFAIGDKLESIHELSISDIDKLPSIMKNILILLRKDEITVLVNSLNIRLNNALELICEDKKVEEEIMWKVYKWIPFLKMCFELNKNCKTFVNTTEVYKIGDLILEVTVKDDQFIVQEVNKKADREFSELEFIRFVLGNTTHYKNSSLIFPLALDFNNADLF